jgi:hypothetical protein
MTIPYKIEELDALIRACVEFTDDFREPFFEGNIAGRTGVETDNDAVRRMMDWVSETDKGILECMGPGKDNITYFRLGYDARRIIEKGGFRTYLSQRRRIAVLDQIRTWAPICISLLSLAISVVVWTAPQGGKGLVDTNRRIDVVNERIDGVVSQIGPLQTVQEQIRSRVDTMQSILDAMSTPTKAFKK